jgi:hypothetical protein
MAGAVRIAQAKPQAGGTQHSTGIRSEADVPAKGILVLSRPPVGEFVIFDVHDYSVIDLALIDRQWASLVQIGARSGLSSAMAPSSSC